MVSDVLKYGKPIGSDGRYHYYRLSMIIRTGGDGDITYVCSPSDWPTTEEARVVALRAQDQIDALKKEMQRLQKLIEAVAPPIEGE